MGQCQAAVAEVITLFRRLDVLFCCTSQGVFKRNPLSTLIGRQDNNVDGLATVGTVEEFGTSSRTIALARDQFETNYFGPVNIIKAALPSMRAKHSGHIILLSGISWSRSSCNTYHLAESCPQPAIWAPRVSACIAPLNGLSKGSVTYRNLQALLLEDGLILVRAWPTKSRLSTSR